MERRMEVSAIAMDRAKPEVGGGSGILGIVILLTGLGAVALLASGGGTYDSWAAVVVTPILVAVSLPALRRQALREGDRRLFAILAAALILKLLGALVRQYFAVDVYQGASDAIAYHEDALDIAARFRAGIFDPGLDSLTESDFIRLLTGLIYTVIGPSQLAGFLVFSWLAFWGLFLSYRAFRLAVPDGRGRAYAIVLFFLPSVLYWPSSIGKEAWLMFALGLTAFGTARLLTGSTVRGLMLAGLGVWSAAVVRPHLGAFAGVAIVVAYFARKPRSELGPLAFFGKALILAGLVAVAAVLIRNTEEFLSQSRVNTDLDARSLSADIVDRTQTGGSEFTPYPILESPANATLAVPTVLFRPLLFEANNIQSGLAALEGSFLLVLAIFRLRSVLAAIASIRRQPYLAFALTYSALSIVALSLVANFGILARQRTLLLPFALALVWAPSRRASRPVEEPKMDLVHA
jgi:hypothetical protein